MSGGPVLERLRDDVDAIAALTGMEGVFKLRAADVYRVTSIDAVPTNQRADGTGSVAHAAPDDPGPPDLAGLAELPSFRDDLEGRLIMLKRRLEEREAP